MEEEGGPAFILEMYLNNREQYFQHHIPRRKGYRNIQSQNQDIKHYLFV